MHNKRVLYRADLNVPLTEDNKHISDDTRLKATLPTLQLLLSKGGRVVLCSHLGRPELNVQISEEVRSAFSLAPVAEALKQLLPAGAFWGFVDDCVGEAAEAAAQCLQPGQVRRRARGWPDNKLQVVYLSSAVLLELQSGSGAMGVHTTAFSPVSHYRCMHACTYHI